MQHEVELNSINLPYRFFISQNAFCPKITPVPDFERR